MTGATSFIKSGWPAWDPNTTFAKSLDSSSGWIVADPSDWKFSKETVVATVTPPTGCSTSWPLDFEHPCKENPGGVVQGDTCTFMMNSPDEDNAWVEKAYYVYCDAGAVAAPAADHRSW